MRYGLILAGGSGTRLWPMSRAEQPKQLIPFINGKSLLQVAVDRLNGFIPPDRVFVCALEQHREQILSALPEISSHRYIGEPMGRDTLAAIAYSCALVAKRDPDAVIGVFTSDHLIEPIPEFQRILEQGFQLAEDDPETLVTFGITPDVPATNYGYLELGSVIGSGPARVVRKFQEKPKAPIAQEFFDAGPERYLWNSGMFVWRAATLLECVREFKPAVYEGIRKAVEGHDSVAEVYPELEKVSIDFAVMQKARKVAAVPMQLKWLDVGSWPMYARTCATDEDGNAVAARTLLSDTKGTLVASSDPKHVIVTEGCEDLIIIHTPRATLVCRADRAEKIKDLHAEVGKRFGEELV